MTLYLLRHGIAVERGTPGYANDPDRPLTSEGERKLWKICRGMETLDLSFDLILFSPYVRARATAQIVADAFRSRKKLACCDPLAADGDVRALIPHLQALPRVEKVVLVGHEPFLSNLVSLLVSGGNGFGIALKKGGLCKLEVASLKAGRCATLEWLLTPRQLMLMER